MKHGDYVRFTAAWLLGQPRGVARKLAKDVARVETVRTADTPVTLGDITLNAKTIGAEVSYPGSKRRNVLLNAEILEVVEEA